MQLESTPLSPDTVGLLEGICTNRAIRRYHDEPVPEQVLRDVLFAACRAPSGSNRQPFRFIVLTDGPNSAKAKALIGSAARRIWSDKRVADGYGEGSGLDPGSPKARLARVMAEYVDTFEQVPVLVLACMVRYRDPASFEGASVYPACQNLLLAARALGYGGVMTGWHMLVESELRTLLELPEDVAISATITMGRPKGSHGPVRRLPISELVYQDRWGLPSPIAHDPPGTRHTSAGPAPPGARVAERT